MEFKLIMSFFNESEKQILFGVSMFFNTTLYQSYDTANQLILFKLFRIVCSWKYIIDLVRIIQSDL